MKNSISRFATVASLAGVLMFATSTFAQDMVRYNSKPGGSKVTVAGTSTIHDWTLESQIIGGFMEVPKGVVLDSSQATVAGLKDGKLDARVESFIPVSALKSGKKGMDEVMQQAMDQKNNPRIIYRVSEMKLKEPHAAGTPFQFDTKGELAIHGVTNKISMPVTMETVDKTKLKVAGSIPLKMTDYKVTPPAPSIGLGLIKTGDEVKISFEWVVSQPEAK